MVHKKKHDVVTTFLNYDLHGAAAAGNIGLVKYAITHGQPINAVLGGLLPLHAAASGGSVEVVQYLLDHRADPNAPRMPSSTGPPIGVGGAGSMVGPGGIIGGGDGNGANPNDSAAEKHRGRLGSSGGLGHHHHHHHGHVISSSSGARPGSGSVNNSGNSNASLIPIGRRGSTPLHFAAAMGHLDVVKLLLENGAKPSTKDAERNTPEAVAKAAGRTKVVEFLREWQFNAANAAPQATTTTGTGTGTPRRSLESPQPGASRPNQDLKLSTANGSTASLPLVTSPPAALSTSSLGRYPNGPGRRPSLPSIYESSPPSTSYPRPTSNKRQGSEPMKPSASRDTPMGSPAMPSGSTSKSPFSIRRPKSAGNKEGKDDDAASQISQFSSKTQPSSSSTTTPTQTTSSRLNKIFKRPNLRPATASGALSAASSPTSPSPPAVGRSRSPSASKVQSEKEKDRSGGFFHVPSHLPHLPHLPRRGDHAPHHAYQHHPNPHHLHLQHVSRDAISGPIMNGQSTSTSIPDIAHPETAEPLTGSTSLQTSPLYSDVNTGTPSDDGDEEAMLRALNLTPGELQYAKTRGALPDRLRSPPSMTRTAPPGQTSFGLGKPPSHPTLSHHPSYTGLSGKASYATVPSPKIVPRHRAHLGPGGGLGVASPEPGPHDEFGQGRSRTEPPVLFGPMNTDKLSPGVRVAHPIPSLTSLNRQVRNMRAREQNGSISSMDSALTGTSGSNELSRSPLGGEDLVGVEYPPARMFKTSPGGNQSPVPSPLSLPMTEYGPNGVGLLPLSDGRVISSRAQASELVEAHKRAIQSSLEQRERARKMMGGTPSRGHASPLPEPSAIDLAPATTTTITGESQEKENGNTNGNLNVNGNGSSPNPDTEEDEGDESFGEEDINALREKLAALGESVQIERTFAKREQLTRRWNRESGVEEGGVEESVGTVTGAATGGLGIGPASLGASVLARNEMLDGYLRQGVQLPGSVSDSEKVKRAVTPVRDVFGRPVTPKKEARPPTPKEARPTTPKNIPLTPTSARFQDAPRENRVLPPLRAATTHLALQQTRAISKSDLALNSHISRDLDPSGRERAWTTTDVRPRIGPASASRPSTAGSKPGGAGSNGGLTIDIIQTMPTPTDGGATPLRGQSPMTPLTPSSKEHQEQETIQSRRRVISNPLRIDATAAQQRSLSKDSVEDGPKHSPNPSADQEPRSRSSSKPRRAATPTKGEPSSILLHRITTTPPVAPPVIALVPPTDTPFSSFLVTPPAAQDSAPDSPIPTAPVPALPSAVSLHNMHVKRAREEAMKAAAEMQAAGRQASPSPPSHGQGDALGMPLSAGERRLGIGAKGKNEFGYESVRSFNEERPATADSSWKLWSTTDSRESDGSGAKSSKTKLGGFLSRLKR